MQISPAFVAWDAFEQDNAGFYEALRASDSGKAYFERFASWLRENGMDRDVEQHTPDHILALVPRALQPNADRVPDSVRFVGPCLDPARLAESWTPSPFPRRWTSLRTPPCWSRLVSGNICRPIAPMLHRYALRSLR